MLSSLPLLLSAMVLSLCEHRKEKEESGIGLAAPPADPRCVVSTCG